MEPGMTPLASRFRLLLLAFPRHYRRARGAEMLATLLDGSLPGQQWPTLRSALSVVWSGIRCRFRLRPGTFSKIAAAVTTLTGVAFGSLLGTWAAWNWTAGPLPSDSEADAIARSTVVAEPRSHQRFDFIFGDASSIGLGVQGNIWYFYGTDEEEPIRAQATQALRANGWTVMPGQCCVDIAVKGEVRMYVTDYDLIMVRATPSTVPWFTAVGALLGMYAGWMLTARNGRLLARRTTRQKIAAAAAAAAGFSALLPAIYYAVFHTGYNPFIRDPWWVFHWEPVRNLTFAGFAAILLAVTLAELPPRARTGPASISQVARHDG